MASTPSGPSTFGKFMARLRTPSSNRVDSPQNESRAGSNSIDLPSPSQLQLDEDLELPTFEMGADFYDIKQKNSPYKSSPVPRSAASSSVASLASQASTATAASNDVDDDAADRTAVPRPGSSLSRRGPSPAMTRAAESTTSVNSLASSGGRSFLNKSIGQSSSSEKEGTALKGLKSGWARSKEALSSSLKKSNSQSSTAAENTSPDDVPMMSARAPLTRLSSDERPAASASSAITPAPRGLLSKSSRFTRPALDASVRARPRRAQRVLVEDGNEGGSEGGEGSQQDTPPAAYSPQGQRVLPSAATSSPPVHLRTRSDLVPASPKIAPPPERAAATVSIPSTAYVQRSVSALGIYGDSSPKSYAELGTLQPRTTTSSSLTNRAVPNSAALRQRMLMQSNAAAAAHAGSSPEDGAIPHKSHSSPDLSPPSLGSRSASFESRRPRAEHEMLAPIDEGRGLPRASTESERRSPPNSEQFEDGVTLQPRSQSSLGFSTSTVHSVKSSQSLNSYGSLRSQDQENRPLQIYSDENAGAPANYVRPNVPSRPVLGETFRANSAAMLSRTVQAMPVKRQQEAFGQADYQVPLRDGSPGLHADATPSMTAQPHYTSQNAAAYHQQQQQQLQQMAMQQQQQQRAAYPPMQPPPTDQSLPAKPVKKSAGLIAVNGKVYHRAGVLGRGGSSRVYRVLDEKNNLFAVKKVDIRTNDPETRASFINEIHLLEKLRGHPQIITLIDSEMNEAKKTLSMVMEVGETDLNNLLNEHAGKAVSLNFIRYIWEQMLEAVQVIHDENVVHTDLKPANFVLVKGRLKLIDFGISKAIGNDTTNISRDQQVGTANYMSPEALLDSGMGHNGKRLMKLGRAADVWSLGCILHQMVYGRTPFAHIRDIGQKIAAIQNPQYVISYPSWTCPLDERGEEKRELAVKIGPDLMDSMKSCLRFEKDKRATIPQLLAAPFLRREGDLTSPASSTTTTTTDGENTTISPALMAAVVKRCAGVFTPEGTTVSSENVKRVAMKMMQELRQWHANTAAQS